MTWAAIIKDATIELGVRSLHDDINNSEQAIIFKRLQDMLEDWSNESLLVYQTERDEFVGDGIKADFTIGDTDDADIRTARPIFISNIVISRDNLSASTIQERSSSWISDGRSLYTVASPSEYSYESNWPLGLLRFNSKPHVQDKITITSSKQFPLPENVKDPVNLPPGYARTITKNLTVEIAPIFGVERLNRITAREAMMGKARLRKQNVQPLSANIDSALQGGMSLGDGRRTSIKQPYY